LKQSPRVWLERFALVVQEFGLHHSQKDYSVYFQLHHGKQILLLDYVNGIVITGDEAQEISELKLYL